ncbi:Ig-like domain-containing protein [Hydrogenoanaerobacterium sp.]|uniref:Ig-like domain-containing protein n=1 Tax=Hydrogenoanaerobacterium sp. TaxID=2953763 RepID=UPI00289B72F6|nr:Ig-like domain-containing protein [Hydrogenoanaerobacterium sp.]
MSKNIFGNKKIIAILLASIFLVITLATGVLAAFHAGTRPDKSSKDDSSVSDVSSDDENSESSSSEEDEEDLSSETLSFNRPSELRAVFLVPGSDFMAGELTETAVKAEVDKAIADAVSFTANAVVVDTAYKDGTIYGSADSMGGFDVLRYIKEKATEKNLLTYATFSVLGSAAQVDNTVIDQIVQDTKSFAERYRLNGIYLDDFYLDQASGGFAAYQANGSGMGYENYMRSMSTSAFKAASDAIRKNAPATQVGLYTTAVWANKASDEQGSNTNATYQSLIDGNADTKKWVEDGLADFVAVKASGSTTDGAIPFESVVSWWGAVASDADIPLYPVHASSKAVTDEKGWASPTELVEQYVAAKKVSSYEGSVFDSLKALTADPEKSTTTLLGAFQSKVNLANVLTKLALTKPNKPNITTAEQTYTLMGASAPDFELTMNGEKVERDANGYFSITADLKEGANVFKFEHKGDVQTYTITRQTQVLKEISPTGNLTVEGGMTVSIIAMAYPDATVSATINGATVAMTKSTTEDDNIDKNQSYVKFVGNYKTPTTTANKNIGNIVVTATSNGMSKTLTGAAVTITPKAPIGDGQLVEVKAAAAETFPDDTLDDLSNGNYFPIGRGARDYTVSDELEYNDGNKTHYYYLLDSGRRVYSKDISTVSGADLNGNKVSSMSVSSGGGVTRVTFKTDKQVSYTLKHSGSNISIQFHYTTSTPGSSKVGSNPLFTSASWSGSTVTLKLGNSRSFIGYTAEYSGGDLIFRFKNSPGGLRGARVYIDTGHSADSTGADGYISPSDGGMTEYDINLAVSKKLKSILESNGATVSMPSTSRFVELEDRMAKAESFDPHILVSVHANSSTSSSARGSEAFYFYNFASGLASNVSANMASALDITNRKAKSGRYYMTRTSQFAATLSESAFVSNADEYAMLTDSDYQYALAKGIAQGINSYLASAAGSSSGGDIEDGDGGDDSSEEDVPVTSVSLNKSTLQLTVGGSETLEATVKPTSATNKKVTWSSSKETVATVSTDGKVTAKGKGTATITATTKDGGKTAKCTVTVTDKGIVLEDVTITDPPSIMEVGKTYTFKAFTTPDNATNVTYEWSVDNSNIATINKTSGVLTAKAAGNVKVTVTAKSGGVTKTDYDTIKVIDKIVPVTNVTLDQTSLTLNAGESKQLVATVTPSNATNAKVSWKSDNKEITVDKNGLVAVSASITKDVTATITVTTEDGSKKATCKVTGKYSAPPATVEPSEVQLSESNLTLKAGETAQLVATVLPENAADRSVTWSSSDDAIATVVGGKVTAVSAGSATITVKTKNGKTATCKINVSAEQSSSSSAEPPSSAESSSSTESS